MHAKAVGHGEVSPHLTQCCLGRDIPPYQVVSWSIQQLGHNRQGLKSGEAYFQSPKFLGHPQPQAISATGSGHCGWKTICQEVGVDQQKILRYWTKYAFFAYHLQLINFLPMLNQNSVGRCPQVWYFFSTFIVNETSVSCLLICWAVSKLHASDWQRVGESLAKFEVFPSQIF